MLKDIFGTVRVNGVLGITYTARKLGRPWLGGSTSSAGTTGASGFSHPRCWPSRICRRRRLGVLGVGSVGDLTHYFGMKTAPRPRPALADLTLLARRSPNDSQEEGPPARIGSANSLRMWRATTACLRPDAMVMGDVPA